MKYLLTALPMLAGIEVVSWLCLILITAYILCDIAKAAERRGY